MVYAIITAAGKGTRANLGIPKQFYEVNDKPLICYTLDVFEKSDFIDGIILVLDKEHIEKASSYFEKFNYKKILGFVNGGETNELSIFNGLNGLKSIAKNDDIVLIHDGVRCLVNDDIINDNINVCRKNGNAIACVRCNEAMLYSKDGLISNKCIDRNTLMKTQTPHSMYYGDCYRLFSENVKNGNISSIALCTLLIENNMKVYFSKGSNDNFKITNPEDIRLFKAFIDMKDNPKNKKDII